MAESLFATIKTELIYGRVWDTRHDAELAVFSWIEGWYNPQRIQQVLGMLSPDEYEATAALTGLHASLAVLTTIEELLAR